MMTLVRSEDVRIPRPMESCESKIEGSHTGDVHGAVSRDQEGDVLGGEREIDLHVLDLVLTKGRDNTSATRDSKEKNERKMNE